jgi:hypothetical protein
VAVTRGDDQRRPGTSGEHDLEVIINDLLASFKTGLRPAVMSVGRVGLNPRPTDYESVLSVALSGAECHFLSLWTEFSPPSRREVMMDAVLYRVHASNHRATMCS